jgi:2-C-methyl-D-erythritol 4-phosphate cytidylyltransferase
VTAQPTARRVFAVVPAAGRGERFAAQTPDRAPKQYAALCGATVIEW